MWCQFFSERLPQNWDDVKRCDTEMYGRFFRTMLDRGVYLAPSQFEAAFLSTTHVDSVIETTLEAGNAAFRALARS